MDVVIVGGGRMGSHLAQELLTNGHSVRLIENRLSVLDRLRAEMPAAAIVDGDGSSPAVLEAAGIHHAQVLAAVTGEDEANLVVATLARFEYNVPRIIARVNNPKNAWLFTDEMGVDVALNRTDILTKLIAEEMSMGDMMTLVKLRKGEFAIVEEKVHPNAVAVGKEIRELNLPPDCVLVAVLRKGQVIMPRGNVTLNAVDEIIALVHGKAANQLAVLLGNPAH